MEALLAAIEATSWAQALRVSRWGYAAVNTAHVLGIAVLVGAVLPLDLRLLGLWPGTPREALVRVLTTMATAGLALAMATGVALFAIRAQEYGVLGVFRLKLALVTMGTVSALLAHWRHGPLLEGANDRELAAHGAISLLCWLGALVCGRLIPFVST